MGLGSNGHEEMSSVQQTSSSSGVSICRSAIPLEQLQHVLRPWFYFHPWIVFNENQRWSGARQMRGQSGSLQASFLEGGVHHCHPILVPAPCSFTAKWKKMLGKLLLFLHYKFFPLISYLLGNELHKQNSSMQFSFYFLVFIPISIYFYHN